MPTAGSQMVKSLRGRGSGFITSQMDWISGRGVKYCPAPFLPSLAAFSKQALERLGLHVLVERGPLGLVDQGDELLQVDRVVKPGHRLGEDVAEDAGLLAERAEHVGVVVGQGRAALRPQAPATRSPSGSSTPRSSAILRNSR